MEENDHTQFPTLLSGAAVNIKHLEITINDNFSDAETFAAFINSIHRLEEITFHVDDRDLDEYGKSSDPLEEVVHYERSKSAGFILVFKAGQPTLLNHCYQPRRQWKN